VPCGGGCGGEEEERSEQAREARAGCVGGSERDDVRYISRKGGPDERFVSTNICEKTDASLCERRREGHAKTKGDDTGGSRTAPNGAG